MKQPCRGSRGVTAAEWGIRELCPFVDGRRSPSILAIGRGERPLAIISGLREGARKASLASNGLLIWAIIFEGDYGSGSSWRALKRGHHLMAVLAETP